MEVAVGAGGGLEVRWREPLLSNSSQRVRRFFLKGREADAGAARALTLGEDVALVPASRTWIEAVEVVVAAEGGGADRPSDEECEGGEAAGGGMAAVGGRSLRYQFEAERQAMCLTAAERELRDEVVMPRGSLSKEGKGEEGHGERMWRGFEGPRATAEVVGGWVTRNIEGCGPAKTVSVAVQVLAPSILPPALASLSSLPC